MYRRKVVLITAAIFALGVALAAQPTSDRSDRSVERVQQVAPWVPGANMLMSAHELNIGTLAPPPGPL